MEVSFRHIGNLNLHTPARAATGIRAACGLALAMFHHDLNHTGTLSCCADGCGEVEFTSGGELVSSSYRDWLGWNRKMEFYHNRF